MRFATKASAEAFEMTNGDMDALAEHGWNEREAIEALTVVSNVSYIAVANLALGIDGGS